MMKRMGYLVVSPMGKNIEAARPFLYFLEFAC